MSKLDLRIGYIREVSRHPDADTLYVEEIECGDEPGNENENADSRGERGCNYQLSGIPNYSGGGGGGGGL